MKPSLQLKLSQHLALTPQLQQSIKLLQLSTLELNQEIEKILLENPMIERTLFNADHEAFRDSFRRFVDKQIAPHHAAWEEQGFVDFESSNFKGLAAPAKTPPPVIEKMHQVLLKVMSLPDVNERLVAGGSLPRTTTPAQFAEENRREVERWGKLMRAHGIFPQ